MKHVKKFQDQEITPSVNEEKKSKYKTVIQIEIVTDEKMTASADDIFNSDDIKERIGDVECISVKVKETTSNELMK